MKKVKNVLAALIAEYKPIEITIIDNGDEKILFSGTASEWKVRELPEFQAFVEDQEVTRRDIFHNKHGYKVFVFVENAYSGFFGKESV